MYHEYASTLLDKENLTKLEMFVDKIYSCRKGERLYFYGTGANGKTTLVNKMIAGYPSLFSRDGTGRVTVLSDGVGPAELDVKENYIIVTNEFPVAKQEHIVYFKKMLHGTPAIVEAAAM